MVNQIQRAQVVRTHSKRTGGEEDTTTSYAGSYGLLYLYHTEAGTLSLCSSGQQQQQEAVWAGQPPFPKLGSRTHILLSQPSLQLSSINSSLLDTPEESELVKNFVRRTH